MFEKIKTWLYNMSMWLYLDTIFWAALVMVSIYFLAKNN
jgi:hypothetical protein